MGLDEVRRRNRRAIALLALLALVDLWLVVGIVLAAAGLFMTLPWELVVVGAGPGAGLGIVAYLWWRLRHAAWHAVRNLDAHPIEAGSGHRLEHLMEEVSIATGLPPIGLAVLDDPVPNALTVGCGGSAPTALIVTSGLVEQLTRDELEAVVAVELCAVARLDVALRTVVFSCGGGLSWFRHWISDGLPPVYGLPFWVVTWPMQRGADLVRRRAHRRGDFGADDMAIAALHHPDALGRALLKLLEDPRIVGGVTELNSHLWFEPIPDRDVPRQLALSRFAMAPSLEDRIARLPVRVTPSRRRRLWAAPVELPIRTHGRVRFGIRGWLQRERPGDVPTLAVRPDRLVYDHPARLETPLNVPRSVVHSVYVRDFPNADGEGSWPIDAIHVPDLGGLHPKTDRNLLIVFNEKVELAAHFALASPFAGSAPTWSTYPTARTRAQGAWALVDADAARAAFEGWPTADEVPVDVWSWLEDHVVGLRRRRGDAG